MDANSHCFVPTPKNQPSLDLLASVAALREFCFHQLLSLHLDLSLFFGSASEIRPWSFLSSYAIQPPSLPVGIENGVVARGVDGGSLTVQQEIIPPMNR